MVIVHHCLLTFLAFAHLGVFEAVIIRSLQIATKEGYMWTYPFKTNCHIATEG